MQSNFLLYYNPFDEVQIDTVKRAYVERIGAECTALDVPSFLELLVYDDTLGDEKELAFARKKPEYVVRALEEFSRPRYRAVRRGAWHPQGPIHPSPPPRATTCRMTHHPARVSTAPLFEGWVVI